MHNPFGSYRLLLPGLLGAVLGAAWTPAHSQTTAAARQNETALTAATAEMPGGPQGRRYTQTFTASGGVAPYTFQVTGDVPAGMRWAQAENGLLLDGIPNVAGDFPFTVRVTDEAGQVSTHTYVMQVTPADTGSSINIPVAEGVSVNDLPFVGFPLRIDVAEGVSVADVPAVFFPLMIAVTEGVSVSDAPSVSPPLRINVAEGVSVADVPEVFFPVMINVTEGVSVSDVPAAFFPLTISVTEGVSVTDLPFVSPPLMVTVNEKITVTDTVSLSSALQINVSEPISVSDTVFGTPVQVAQSITIGTLATPTYGGSPFSLSATSTSGLPVTITPTGGPVTGSGNGPYTMTGAGTATFTATQPGNADYTAASAINFSVTILPATLVVRPTSVARPFDTPNPAFTYTVGPFVNGDTAAVISGTPTLSTTAIGTSPAGTYPITANVSATTATNYVFSPVAGTLTINGGNAQTIVFPQPPTLATGQSYHLAAFTTSGLPVTYEVSGAGSLSGNYVIASGSPGTITVTASQPGNASYAAAMSAVRSFNVQ